MLPESLSIRTTGTADVYSIGCVLNYMLTGQEPGVLQYKGNHYIERIIEKSTNEDPAHRYHSVDTLCKDIDHEMRIHPIDNIPFIRAVPGFRSHTFWKEIIAGLAYLSMPLIGVITFNLFEIMGIFEIFFFYIIVPLIVIFNMGNLLRFIPQNIRTNNLMMILFRTVSIFFL